MLITFGKFNIEINNFEKKNFLFKIKLIGIMSKKNSIDTKVYKKYYLYKWFMRKWYFNFKFICRTRVYNKSINIKLKALSKLIQ